MLQVHLVTYVFIPREHRHAVYSCAHASQKRACDLSHRCCRVLWTDTIELLWVAVISLHHSQENQRQQISSSRS